MTRPSSTSALHSTSPVRCQCIPTKRTFSSKRFCPLVAEKAHIFTGSLQTMLFVEIISMAAGDFHSMVLKQDGSVWSCGLNTDGQLGIPFVTYASDSFKQTTISSGAKAIAAGVVHSLVLKKDDSLWMTGKQIGFGEQPKRQRFEFVRVIEGAKAIAAGSGHTIVLTESGGVWSMGQNNYGQLGDGSYNDKGKFVRVMRKGVKAVAAGHLHSMVMKTDGSVWATGWNGDGQIGATSKGDKSKGRMNFFSQIMSDALDMAAGAYHSMILRLDGSVWTTGWNMYGQLGDGTTKDRNFYHKVAINTKTVAAGTRHSVILKDDGSVWTTSFNMETAVEDYEEPVTGVFMQAMASGGEAVVVSSYHSMVLKNDGTIWAAGSNKFGQLGYRADYKDVIERFVQMQIGDGAVQNALVASDLCMTRT